MIDVCDLFMWSVSQFVIEMRVLEHLERCVAIGKSYLDIEVFHLLSNILSGTPQQIQVIRNLVYVSVVILCSMCLVAFLSQIKFVCCVLTECVSVTIL